MTKDSKAMPASSTWTLLGIALPVVVAAVVWAGPGQASAQDPSSCDPARPHAAGAFDETITTSDGREREYILHVPSSYTGAWAMPLVFNFHGGGLTDDFQVTYTALNAKADEAGFITVTPQGLSTEKHEAFGWNFALAPPETGEPDDVAFASELLDELETTLCVDAGRVYSTGLSNGGFMSVRLACSLSDRVAAIAPIASAYFPPLSNDFTDPNESCPDTRPVPVIAFHGSADRTVPFEGGLSGDSIDHTHTYRLSIEEAISEWAAHNGCDDVPMEEQATQSVRLVRYQGCDEDATVELYVIEGGGHTWPDAALTVSEEIFGVTTHEISANDLMWDFFLAHPMPGAAPLAPTPEPNVTDEDLTAPTSGTGPASGDSAAVWLLAALAVGALALGGAAWYARRRLRS